MDRLKRHILLLLVYSATACAQKTRFVLQIDSLFLVDKNTYLEKSHNLINSNLDLVDKISILDNEYLYSKDNIKYKEEIQLSFKNLFFKNCQKAYSPIYDTIFYAYIKDQFIRYRIIDERNRKGSNVDSLIQVRRSIDQENKIKLSNITSVNSFLCDECLSCKKIAELYFTLIQHSDIKILNQQFRYLDSLSLKGFIDRKAIALMTDRIRVENNQLQLYGTQVKMNTDGKNVVFPIEDEKNVDKRRESVGLSSLKEYLKKFDIDYIPVP